MRVLVCDDELVVRKGLKLTLESFPDIQVIGLAEDGREALNMVSRLKPDIVLMDLKMPRMDGLSAIIEMRQAHPAIPVIALTTYNDEEHIVEALRGGAAGYLLKSTPPPQIVEAMRGTLDGQSFLDPVITRTLLSHIQQNEESDETSLEVADLTAREMEIWRLIGRGYSNSDIAGELFLSEGTVKNYVSSLLQKLGVSDRTQAALLAVQRGER